MRAVAVAVALAAAAVGPRRAAGQLAATPRPMPELRVDVMGGPQPAVQAGAGVQVAAGYYARIGLDVAVGRRVDALSPSLPSRLDGRLDLLARFLLDPFRQSPYGLSLGGGMTFRAEPGDRVRPLLLAAIDLEGRRSTHGWVPAVQLGLGGGVRAGVILRRGVPGWR